MWVCVNAWWTEWESKDIIVLSWSKGDPGILWNAVTSHKTILNGYSVNINI